MKKVIILAAISLSACNIGHVNTIPPAPSTVTVVHDSVPIPVLCATQVTRHKADIDTAKTGTPLEDQDAMLRASVAQQRSYIATLESSIIGCGGKINN